MSIRKIIEKYLNENSFDGLYSGECGCLIGDLAPDNCNGIMDCSPGHARLCSPRCDVDCQHGYIPHQICVTGEKLRSTPVTFQENIVNSIPVDISLKKPTAAPKDG